jgi:hypothetical protein
LAKTSLADFQKTGQPQMNTEINADGERASDFGKDTAKGKNPALFLAKIHALLISKHLRRFLLEGSSG